jgi:hypothetical protein
MLNETELSKFFPAIFFLAWKKKFLLSKKIFEKRLTVAILKQITLRRA